MATEQISGLEKVDAYCESRREVFEDQLKTLLRIPSISAQPAHNADTRRAAEFLLEDLKGLGLDTELIETQGHPILLAEHRVGADLPTLLIYGHYDVQPPEPMEPWLTPPFEPTVRDGNIYARGATDDKGQMFTHLKATEAWIRTQGQAPVNLKILIEGEEEVGGINLELFLKEHAERLQCDFAVISDTSQFAPGMPAITYGLRGMAYFEVFVHGPQTDLHSGHYGGAVGNPAMALSKSLAALIDDQGQITLPGFYDPVRPLEAWERKQFADLPANEPEMLEYLGVSALQGEQGYTARERTWARPSCDVNGLSGGYQGPGPKTVLPRVASAKVSFRLVADQNPAQVKHQFQQHLDRTIPQGSFRVELIEHHGAPATLVNTESPAVHAAVRAIEAGFGTKPVFIRAGGSIPVVGLIKECLGVDTLLLGWGQEDDNLHGPNEKFCLADFHRGIRASAHLMAELAS